MKMISPFVLNALKRKKKLIIRNMDKAKQEKKTNNIQKNPQ